MSSEHVTINEARAVLGDLIIRVREGGERITLTRYGRPAAVLVSVKDAERLDATEREQDAQGERE